MFSEFLRQLMLGSARIAAQFVGESVLLGVAGWLIGLLAAYLALGVFSQMAVDLLPRAQGLQLSWRVVALSASGTLLISTAISLIAARSGNRAIAATLKEAAEAAAPGAPPRGYARDWLSCRGR